MSVPHSYGADLKAIDLALTQLAQCISVLANQDMTRPEIMVEESRPILKEALHAFYRLPMGRNDGPNELEQKIVEFAMARLDEWQEEYPKGIVTTGPHAMKHGPRRDLIETCIALKAQRLLATGMPQGEKP